MRLHAYQKNFRDDGELHMDFGLLNVEEDTAELAQKCICELGSVWNDIDRLVFYNQVKVLEAFRESKISSTHLWPSTGYGYQDVGREGLESLFAKVFGAESSLVRLSFASGTHVLKTVLFGLLRPGDELLSLTGRPYETLCPVIGIDTPDNVKIGSLKDFGVKYKESTSLIDFETGVIDEFDLIANLKALVSPQTSLILIQRSRGYSHRKTISIESIKKISEILGMLYPSVPVFVDNCYCEFTDPLEPPAVGIAVTAGSLIKNPGGGLAPTGGYVVGKRQYVDLVAHSLYAPGLGKEAGSNPYGYRDTYQGLFLAPKVVGESLKGASFASLFFGKLGYKVDPAPFDRRQDIVQEILLETPENLRSFAQTIQAFSPIDSFATPEPWDMPGYSCPVIMAAGTFVQGASIELSADGPFAPPYSVYLQGGLTKEHVIYACMKAKDTIWHKRSS